MKNKIFKVCTITLLLIIILFNSSSNIFAAINTNYDVGNAVEESNLEKKVNDSIILDALGSFIYATASLVEYIVGKAFQGITGINTFPWADKVIFNSVPMLDVNFFNPASGSMFKSTGGTSTALSDIVRSTYFTILAIAIGFLVVVVGISAIKLALSSLASEKAKYKEALSKWLFSIVMLFLMHNLMSFIFFVNEKMVEVASGILNKRLDQTSINLILEEKELLEKESVNNFIRINNEFLGINSNFIANIFEKEDIETIKDTLTSNEKVSALLLENGDYNKYVLFDASVSDEAWYKEIANAVKQAYTRNGYKSIKVLYDDVKLITDGSININNSKIGINSSISVEDLRNVSKMSDDEIELSSGFKYYAHYKLMISDWADNLKDIVMNLSLPGSSIISDVIKKVYTSANIDFDSIGAYKKYAAAIVQTYDQVNGNSNGNEKMNLISNIAEYLKKSAYTVPTDSNGNVKGWSRSKITIQGALLYGIFVFQSIFYLFSYIRRFFYIVVLAVMAPAIVILDFLGKSLS